MTKRFLMIALLCAGSMTVMAQTAPAPKTTTKPATKMAPKTGTVAKAATKSFITAFCPAP